MLQECHLGQRINSGFDFLESIVCSLFRICITTAQERKKARKKGLSENSNIDLICMSNLRNALYEAISGPCKLRILLINSPTGPDKTVNE